MIHYFGPGDELPNATAGFVAEDSDWWVGIQSAGATLALAAALALATSTAAISTQVFSFHQDDPAGNLYGQFDEDFWQNQVAPVTAYAPPQELWRNDEQIPAGNLTATVDEYFWQNPVAPYVAPIVAPQPWMFDDQTPILYGQFDEDFWWNPVPQVQTASIQQPIFDPSEIVPQSVTFAPDEYFWWNPVPVYAGYANVVPFPYAFEMNDVIFTPTRFVIWIQEDDA